MTVDVASLDRLPALPRDDEGPVFRDAWEAQAFAMVVRLHETGHFSWNEWAGALSAEIAAARAGGDPDLGDTYYSHWLAALERLCATKGLASRDAMSTREAEWRRAYLNTPHGQPVALPTPVDDWSG